MSMIDRMTADNKPIPDQIVCKEDYRLLHENVENFPDPSPDKCYKEIKKTYFSQPLNFDLESNKRYCE